MDSCIPLCGALPVQQIRARTRLASNATFPARLLDLALRQYGARARPQHLPRTLSESWPVSLPSVAPIAPKMTLNLSPLGASLWLSRISFATSYPRRCADALLPHCKGANDKGPMTVPVFQVILALPLARLEHRGHPLPSQICSGTLLHWTRKVEVGLHAGVAIGPVIRVPASAGSSGAAIIPLLPLRLPRNCP